MNLKKIIAVSLAALSLVTLISCGEKVCDICKRVPPTHSIKSSKKAELCDYCYQKAVQTETENDVETIKNTDFSALTDRQKNYIVIFVEERIIYYDAFLGELINDELRAKVYNEAAERYSKTAEQVKELVLAHDAIGMEE